ncbi:MAG TPA: excalibur calcium-binding domain-containing protein [Meiothermus sp.]|nr:excalibur calcium-binding domain-containing protein [Meiothermus sp.]
MPIPAAPSRPGGAVSQRWPGGHRPLLQPSAGQIRPSPAKTLTPRFAAKEASRSHVASLTHVSHGLVAWPEGPTRLEGPGDYSSPTPPLCSNPRDDPLSGRALPVHLGHPAHPPTAGTPRPSSPPTPAPSGVYYRNCAEARAAGAAPIYRGQPGYRPALDRDGDGVACER